MAVLPVFADSSNRDQVSGQLYLTQPDVQNANDIQQTLDLNLARVLMQSSLYNEAVRKYQELVAAGMVSICISVTLAFLHAKIC